VQWSDRHADLVDDEQPTPDSFTVIICHGFARLKRSSRLKTRQSITTTMLRNLVGANGR
jgi:hypothetical protein